MSKSKKVKKSPVKKSTEPKTKTTKSPNKISKPKEEIKSKPTQTKENKKSKPKEEIKSKPTQTKENKESKPKEEIKSKPVSPRKRANSMEFFDKYGYDVYTEDEKRQEALGNLVIAFGPSELIKKLDSESMKTPNMSNKFNNDKKWVRDNFKR